MKKFINQKLFLINKNLINNTKEIKIESRNLTILPSYVGKTVQVHNGKKFINLIIVREMINHKLGEFIKTRKNFKFKKK